MKAVLVLASDRVSRGERGDRTAAGVRAALAEEGIELLEVVAVADEIEPLQAALRAACEAAPLVLTSGGTGLGPRDVTPEATRPLLDREVPGLAEAMRAASRARLPTADLSRGVAGTRGTSLVVNLPGSPAGAEECVRLLLPALVHGVRLLADAVVDCADDLERPA